MTLTQESLEKDDGIANLEMAVTELYKALLAGRDNGSYTCCQSILYCSRIIPIPRHGCDHGTIRGVPDL